MYKTSQRGSVAAFRAMEVMARANQLASTGRKIIRMEVGQPSAPTPSKARAAAAAAAAHGHVAYTEPFGHRWLRERIAADYADRDGLAIPVERVAVVTGSSAAFTLAFLAAFEAGDKIAIPAPGYPAYRNIMSALGIRAIDIETRPETGWLPTPEALRAAHAETSFEGFLLASPSNPTGAVASKTELAALISVCKELGVRFISDEIYHRLEFVGASPTAAAFDDTAYVINSFSKFYCMTGWRIGWMIIPDDLVDATKRLAQNFYISPPDASQSAACAAFDCADELEMVKAGYAENRTLLLESLPSLGFQGPSRIDGAFYAYPELGALSENSETFAMRLLEEAGIACTPGTDFDPINGHSALRLSFAVSHADVHEALERLAKWLPTIDGSVT